MANTLKGDKKANLFKLGMMAAAAVAILSSCVGYINWAIFALIEISADGEMIWNLVVDLLSTAVSLLPHLLILAYAFMFFGKKKARMGEALVFGAAAVSLFVVAFFDTIDILDELFRFIEHNRIEYFFEYSFVTIGDLIGTSTNAILYVAAAVLVLLYGKKLRFPAHLIPLGIIVVSNLGGILSAAWNAIKSVFSFGSGFFYYIYGVVSSNTDFWSQLLFLAAIALVGLVPVLLKAPAEEETPVEEIPAEEPAEPVEVVE